MTTAEDVFYLYERNSSYYHNCSQQGKMNTCPDNWNNQCYCCANQEVLPLTIGDQTIPCSIKRKCYIKPNEECPICLENIFRKKESYISGCGHSFHKLCIFKSMETQWNTKYASNYKCPMCRSNIGTDIHELGLRYKFTGNSLDNLENYWLNKDLMLAQMCGNNYDHYIGMKNGCFNCSKYREKGDLVYELSL